MGSSSGAGAVIEARFGTSAAVGERENVPVDPGIGLVKSSNN
jgi:hypothetical protein